MKKSRTNIILEKFCSEAYYRAIKYHVTSSAILVFRYPLKYDKEEYIDLVKGFIIAELQNNKFELTRKTLRFYIEIDDKNVNYIDKTSFIQAENKFIKEVGEWK